MQEQKQIVSKRPPLFLAGSWPYALPLFVAPHAASGRFPAVLCGGRSESSLLLKALP